MLVEFFWLVALVIGVLPIVVLLRCLQEERSRSGENHIDAALIWMFVGWGAACVAAAAITFGLWYKPITANIDGGYSMRGVFDIPFLWALAVLPAAPVGVFVGWKAMNRRWLQIVLALMFVVGLTTLTIAFQRPSVDCDQNPDYCDNRPGIL